MSAGPGLFITLEGGEGAGKSTAAAGLAALLAQAGHQVVQTREPGGTPGAESIRALLLDSRVGLTPMAQSLLHFAARAEHVAALIRPALARGAIVICDRYTDSTMAYQAYGQGVDIAAITELSRLINLTPDLTFILEVPVAVANERLASRGLGPDRYERMGPDFMARVAHGFRAIAAAEPARCVLVDATQPAAQVLDSLRRTIARRLGR